MPNGYKMRNYINIEKYLDELEKDIYKQVPDDWHTQMMKDALKYFFDLCSIDSVLEVGCGNGQASVEFLSYGVHDYTGIDLLADVEGGNSPGIKIYRGDFTFLPFYDNCFDLVYSRHSLEHSPIPLLSLMEWHRVAKNFLFLITPNPVYWGFAGRNHYYVFVKQQLVWLLRRSGWRIIHNKEDNKEYWFICKKEKRIGYEGWADTPLSHKIVELERRYNENRCTM